MKCSLRTLLKGVHEQSRRGLGANPAALEYLTLRRVLGTRVSRGAGHSVVTEDVSDGLGRRPPTDREAEDGQACQDQAPSLRSSEVESGPRW